MSDTIHGGTGAMAQALAAAPVVQRRQQREEKPVVVENSLHKLFRLVTFKLPNKSEAFRNEDGTTTRRLAHAIIALADSQIRFSASIYEQTQKDGSVEIYCGMPSSGKGFPRPVFSTDDPRTQQAYDSWRVDTAKAYLKWETDLNKGQSAPVTHSQAIRINRPAAPQQS